VQSNNEFHDPVLKDAVRRCWACECASKELRNRISGLLKNESVPDTGRMVIGTPPSLRRLAWVIWPMAAAAVLVISLVIFEGRNKSSGSTDPGSTLVATALPESLEAALIHTHDGCSTVVDHQGLPVPRNDDTAIADAMRDRLHQPVLMTHPNEAGWTFRGAAMCPVGGTKSGHLMFARGDERLSVFSLPKTMLPAAVEGSQFAGTFKDHCIVGFVKDGALFCAVETGPAGTISLKHLQQLSEEMKPAVAVVPAAVPGGELAELLRPATP
jgi:hypothetical protein